VLGASSLRSGQRIMPPKPAFSFNALISTPNHCDRVLLVLRLDDFLPRSKQVVQVLDRDSAVELAAEPGLVFWSTLRSLALAQPGRTE
jgi:hypothetical protein